MSFVRDLLSGDESVADAVNASGLASLLAHLGVSGYAVVQHPDPLVIGAFVTGCTAIIGVIGGAKRWRDGAAQPAQQ